MQTVNSKRVEVALDRVGGTDFEHFFQEFYAALMGVEFVPLGGFHDGGADALQDTGLFEAAHRPENFYQATTMQDHRAKIRHTVKRLKEVGRKPKSLQYVTSRVVALIDKEEDDLSDELDTSVRIRDRKWIVNHINHSSQTVAAYHTHLNPYLSFLSELGGATIIGSSLNVPARTLCVFLGQEVELRRGKTELLEAVTDSLILWALEGTDPDTGKFMARKDILRKIEGVLPSAKHFIRGTFNHRIEMMAKKGNVPGREVRWHKRIDKFCLPFETRQIVTEENSSDEALKLEILELYKSRAQQILDVDEELCPAQIGGLVHRSLELTFEQQGLELVHFLTGEQDRDHNFTVSDQVDGAIEEYSLSGSHAVRAKEVALTVLRQAFYNSVEAERIYYGKLSRTYTLMLTLRNEPKIVDYFKSMSSNFVLFVGSDIIVRALSERYLKVEDQMTVNMLRILREAGSTLILTHMTVEEVHAHIKITDYEFQNYFRGLESEINREIARHSGKILIRAYFNARFDPLSEARPAGWRNFIEQICSYRDLREDAVSREQVKNYLMEKFGFKYLDKEDVGGLVDDGEVEKLSDKIKLIKPEDVLAFNDARQILAVYGKRRELQESHRTNPYGYRTWWLTHETRIRQCTAELTKARGSQYIIRPEFILNFVSLSPTTEAVRRSYRTVFPTILGIRLSNRMREEIFRKVLGRAKEVHAVDEPRARAMMAEMVNRLKGDNYKQYENDLMAGKSAS